MGRERWATRLGLILAMAGNAIGLGNFLRFPVQATANGGGAFMIAYILALLLLGIPLMWLEWTLGRYGGNVLGHGTCPNIFYGLTKSKFAKFLGVFSLWVPTVIAGYYVYITSWVLAYAVYYIVGMVPEVKISGLESVKVYLGFFKDLIGAEGFIYQPWKVYPFYLLVMILLCVILYRGVAAGIEMFSKYAMSLLFVFAVVLMIRVLLIETSAGSAVEGLNFLWYPEFEKLKDPHVWIAAAGQIFFTLSLGMGAIVVYASYLPRKTDITLSGLTTLSLNEFCEVILGGTITICAASSVFGLLGAKALAKEGAFTLGFAAMPVVFSTIPFGNFFGFMWFMLLFFAAMTSAIALMQPLIAFLQDDLAMTRKRAVVVSLLVVFILNQFAVFLPGALDEMDLWAGTIIIVLTALIEVIISVWFFKGDLIEEMNYGGYIKAPRIVLYVLKYITPIFLVVMLVSWSYTYIPKVIAKTDFSTVVTRLILVGMIVFLTVLIAKSKFRGGEE